LQENVTVWLPAAPSVTVAEVCTHAGPLFGRLTVPAACPPMVTVSVRGLEPAVAPATHTV